MDLIDLQKIEFHPVLGKNYTNTDFMPLDLSVKNEDIRGLDVVEGLDGFIRNKLEESGKKVAIGGYGEERDFYWSSPLFKSEVEKRTIHLGIDLWTKPLVSIYAPMDATVYGLNNNNLPLDYGYTVVLKHSIADHTFYSLYGHLSEKGMRNLAVGQRIKKGDIFCYIGHPTTNGGWAPHLHLQLIMDMESNRDDYPGVSTKAMQDHYLKNCPSPEKLIFS